MKLADMVIELSVLEHRVARWASVLPWFHVDLPHVPPHLLHSLNGLGAQ